MATPWQPSLLGLQAPTIDPSFRGIRRLELGRGAWVDHLSGWCSGHSRLFETLRQHMHWKTQRRPMYDRVVDVPRLLATVPDDGPGPARGDLLESMATALSGRYGVRFNRITMALYRDGRDSVAWHADRLLRDTDDDSFVATVSVGERRRFLIRPQRGSGAAGAQDGREEGLAVTTALTLGWGDLVVMGGSCQQTMEHAVPKVAHAGPRLAIMFRCG